MPVNKGKKIAVLSFLGQGIKIIVGPVTLLAVSSKLTTEEMSFYFTFFNIIALQQILEMGLGFTIKQFISHAFKKDKFDCLTTDSILEIKSYFKFTLFWFALVAIFVLVIVNLFGLYFFSSYSGNIKWVIPWLVLIIATAISCFVIPITILLEGIQEQEIAYKAKLISSLIYASILCSALFYGQGLYSISIASIISSITIFFLCYEKLRDMIKLLKYTPGFSMSIKESLLKIWPMLSKVSIVWITGYFFWNSFNLIAFQLLTPQLAGKFAFTLSLARAGFSIAESIAGSQSTLLANYISKGKEKLALKQFYKYSVVSFFLLIIGYSTYFLIYNFFPSFYIFKKSLNFIETLGVFFYFLLLLPVILQANYIRCYKEERYLLLSIFANISVPAIFYIVTKFINNIDFLYLLPVIIVMNIWSVLIFNKKIYKGV